MEVILLGTSAAVPTDERNLPSVAIRYGSEIIVFDAGEDVQRKFISAGLKLNKPILIFISHFHADHIIGLPGLIYRFKTSERDLPVKIFAPLSFFTYLKAHSKVFGLHTNFPLEIYEIDDVNDRLLKYESLESNEQDEVQKIEENVLYRNQKYQIKYAIVEHSIKTYAFAFIENERDGKFHPKKAEELGIPPGPIWRELKKGKNLQYNGRWIDPIKEGIVDPKRKGRKVTYSSDTIPCNALFELGKDSDLLIHEATYLEEHREIAEMRLHSTSSDAARSALMMNAKQLLLTHISSRYSLEAEIKLLQEAKNQFPNTILGRDLTKIEIK